MPAGVSWSRYLTFFAASLATGLAGSQTVHLYYKPSLVRFIFYYYCSSFWAVVKLKLDIKSLAGFEYIPLSFTETSPSSQGASVEEIVTSAILVQSFALCFTHSV